MRIQGATAPPAHGLGASKRKPKSFLFTVIFHKKEDTFKLKQLLQILLNYDRQINLSHVPKNFWKGHMLR